MFAADSDTLSIGSSRSNPPSSSLGPPRSPRSTSPRSTSPRSTSPRSTSPLPSNTVSASHHRDDLGHVSATESAREDFNDSASDRSSMAGSVAQRMYTSYNNENIVKCRIHMKLYAKSCYVDLW